MGHLLGRPTDEITQALIQYGPVFFGLYIFLFILRPSILEKYLGKSVSDLLKKIAKGSDTLENISIDYLPQCSKGEYFEPNFDILAEALSKAREDADKHFSKQSRNIAWQDARNRLRLF